MRVDRLEAWWILYFPLFNLVSIFPGPVSRMEVGIKQLPAAHLCCVTCLTGFEVRRNNRHTYPRTVQQSRADNGHSCDSRRLYKVIYYLLFSEMRHKNLLYTYGRYFDDFPWMRVPEPRGTAAASLANGMLLRYLPYGGEVKYDQLPAHCMHSQRYLPSKQSSNHQP
jgi:hypothetical protein